jgi:hypothetical protein
MGDQDERVVGRGALRGVPQVPPTRSDRHSRGELAHRTLRMRWVPEGTPGTHPNSWYPAQWRGFAIPGAAGAELTARGTYSSWWRRASDVSISR